MVLHVSLLFFIARASSRHVSSPVLTRQHFQSTSASAPATTAIALLPRDDLARPLTNSLTCGYTSGLWSSAVTCAPEYSCNYYTEPYSAPNFGCCSSGSGCGYVSTCIDYGASNNPNTGGGVMVGDEEFLWWVATSVPDHSNGRRVAHADTATRQQWIRLSIL